MIESLLLFIGGLGIALGAVVWVFFVASDIDDDDDDWRHA